MVIFLTPKAYPFPTEEKKIGSTISVIPCATYTKAMLRGLGLLKGILSGPALDIGKLNDVISSTGVGTQRFSTTPPDVAVAGRIVKVVQSHVITMR